MILSQTAEYSLRAMALLATSTPGEPVPSCDISQATGIPPHYVSKVMRKLVVAGLCHARRGHHGGFRLARPADQIRFIDIIEAAEPEVGAIGCASGFAACDLENPCPLHDAWSALKDEVLEWAESTTLDSVREYALRPEVSFRHTRPAE